MKNNKKYDSSVREELDRVDWDSVFPKVLKYAVQVSKKFSWLGLKVNSGDLVQEAIAQAYGVGSEGKYRNWNKDTCPNIVVFLIGIIRSMTSHTAEHEVRFPKEALFREDGSIKDNELFATADTSKGRCRSKTPEEELIETERLQEIMDVLDSLENENEDLGMVILCVKEGISQPRFIAQETEFEISKVNNLLKKLRRKLKKFKPQNQKAFC